MTDIKNTGNGDEEEKVVKPSSGSEEVKPSSPSRKSSTAAEKAGTFGLEDVVFLYVEDDAMSRRVVNYICKVMFQCKHSYVFSDEEWLIQNPSNLSPIPDVVFLDIQMKAMGGLQILENLRNLREYKNARFVALTASVMPEQVKKLQQAGFDAGIAKPIDVSTFPDLAKRIAGGEGLWVVSS